MRRPEAGNATRRVATPRAALAPLVGAEEGDWGGRGGGLVLITVASLRMARFSKDRR